MSKGKTIHEKKLAELTGYSTVQLRNLAKAGHIPKPESGEYPTGTTLQGLFKYLREKAKRTQTDYQEQKAKETRLRNQLLELEYEEKNGVLVSMERAQHMISEALLPVRQAILSLPAEQCTNCNPTDPQLARQALQRWVDNRFLPAMRKKIKASLNGKSDDTQKAPPEPAPKQPTKTASRKKQYRRAGATKKAAKKTTK